MIGSHVHVASTGGSRQVTKLNRNHFFWSVPVSLARMIRTIRMEMFTENRSVGSRPAETLLLPCFEALVDSLFPKYACPSTGSDGPRCVPLPLPCRAGHIPDEWPGRIMSHHDYSSHFMTPCLLFWWSLFLYISRSLSETSPKMPYTSP